MLGRGKTPHGACSLFSILLLSFCASGVQAGDDKIARVMCDTNGDTRRDLSDAAYVFVWLFLGGMAPVPLEPLAGPSSFSNGDCNGDARRDISDGIYLLDWLFLGGSPPKEGIVGPTARAQIGSTGGSLVSPDATLTLTIPAGALVDTTEITVTEVPADQVPASIQPIEPDRVYQLGPAGLQFATPAEVAVQMSPGNELGLMVLETEGQLEFAREQRIALRDGQRKLSGQMSHFTHVATKTIESWTLDLDVDTRKLKVGEKVTATVKLSKAATADSGRGDCEFHPDTLIQDGRSVCESDVLLPNTGPNLCSDTDFEYPEDIARSIEGRQFWTCKSPGTAVITFEFDFNEFLSAIPSEGIKLPEGKPLQIDLSISTDVVCEEDKPPPTRIRTGLHNVLFTGNGDGVRLLPRKFALALAQAELLLLIAGATGLVGIDPVTGLTMLNQTFGAPDGSLGNNLLDAQVMTVSDPGPTSPLVLIGASPNAGFIRNRDHGQWGFTQLSLEAIVSVASGGGRVDAQESVAVIPTRGLQFVKYIDDSGFFNIISALSIPRSAFSGTLRSARLPVDQAGSPVLALTTGTDDGTTSTVWVHNRNPAEPAIKLFTIPDPDARVLACMAQDDVPESMGGRVPCIVTTFSGDVYYFIYDPANPMTEPELDLWDFAPGAIGAEFGVRSNGLPWAVVSSFTQSLYTVVLLNELGVVTNAEAVNLLNGCVGSAHAVPFSDWGLDYVAGTCYETGKFFVDQYPRP